MHTLFILDLCLNLGFQVNKEKSVLVSAQALIYLA